MYKFTNFFFGTGTISAILRPAEQVFCYLYATVISLRHSNFQEKGGDGNCDWILDYIDST